MASYSIVDVAKKAGVSKSTVSRVLTGGSVSEKTIQAVRRAMEELDYVPNRNAQGLRGAPTYTIGVAVSDPDALLRRSLTTRLAGMNHVFSQMGYSFLLINGNPAKQDSISTAFRFLEDCRIDGLIFLGDIEDEQQRNSLLHYRQIVYTGERIHPHKGFRVYMGNYNYSRDLYLHLIDRGHTNILTVYEHANQRLLQRRNAAYQQVCQMFHRQPAEHSILDLYCVSSASKTQMETLYEQFFQGGFTAIFADSTELGNQIISDFSQRGLRLKEDYSLVAIQRAADTGADPTITSVCLPDFEYGLQCAQLMIDILQDPSMEYADVQIPYSMEIRSSVKNLLE